MSGARLLRWALWCAVASAAVAGGAAPANPPAASEAAAPLLAWGDDPPAVEVRALAGSRTVTVRYGAIDPVTFYAVLDGDPVTLLFHPEPGGAETVELPFIGGRNALRIGASSPDRTVHVTLDREVVFARLPSDADAAERLRSAPELKHELWKQRTPEAKPASTAAAPATAAPATTPPAATPATGAPPGG